MKTVRFTTLKTCSLLLVGLAAAPLMQASELKFEVPEFFGKPGTEYSEWDRFSAGFGDPGNKPDVTGSVGDGIIRQTVPGGVVTGSGNIYNPAGASLFTLADRTPAPVARIVFQTWTTGTELAYPDVALEYEAAGVTKRVKVERAELARVAGSQGATAVSKWEWDLNALALQTFSIRFPASGPHASLSGVRLDTLLAATSPAITIKFEEPQADRWMYPNNATPGKRTLAPSFGSFDAKAGWSRHGQFVFGFSTASQVTPGLPPSRYFIQAAKVTASVGANEQFEYDPTFDSLKTFLPATSADSQPDSDVGRPVELFGTGFRNGYTAQTWQETDPHSGGENNDVRNVYPALVQNGNKIDVSTNANSVAPFEATPFAIGLIDGLQPGSLVPIDSDIVFGLNLSNPGVRAYLQESLSEGKLFFTIATYHSGSGRTDGKKGYPDFYTKENLVGKPARLELTVSVVESPGPNLRIESVSRHRESGLVTLRFTHQEGWNYQIESSANLRSWTPVPNLDVQFPQKGTAEWVDKETGPQMRFYRIQASN